MIIFGEAPAYLPGFVTVIEFMPPPDMVNVPANPDPAPVAINSPPRVQLVPALPTQVHELALGVPSDEQEHAPFGNAPKVDTERTPRYLDFTKNISSLILMYLPTKFKADMTTMFVVWRLAEMAVSKVVR